MVVQKVPNLMVEGVREVLTANRTYYVRTDGNDSNTGLFNTSGGAFLTIQKAIDVASTLDFSTFDTLIQVAAGTYNLGSTDIRLKSFVGSGLLRLTGDATTPANVALTGTAANGLIQGYSVEGRYVIRGFKFTNTGNGHALNIQGAPSFVVHGNNDYGNVGTGRHIVFADGAKVTNIDPVSSSSLNYTISGSCGSHLFGFGPSSCGLVGATVTITGTPAWSIAFAVITSLAYINSFGMTFSGSATGKRYDGALGAIFGSVPSTTYFPGSTSGTITTGAVYAGSSILSGQTVAFVGERGSSVVGNWFAFGNGSTVNPGPVMPFAGRLLSATMQVNTATAGTHTAQVIKNGAVNASYQLSLNWSSGVATTTADFSSNPLTFAAGDYLNWQITAQPATAVWCLTFFVTFE